MSYPPDVAVEILVNNGWLDITTDVLDRQPIQIRRGRTSESNNLQPSQLSLSINNASGRYWPRNPLSDLFGLIGRNTPIRVREGTSRQTNGALLFGSDTPGTTVGQGESSISSPGGPQWDLASGDLDVRIHVDPAEGWRPAFPRVLASIYAAAGDRSWVLWLEPSGELTGRWSTDGAALFTESSTVPVPDGDDLALRWTQEHDDIAGENTWTFYTAANLDGAWTPLGTPVVTADAAGEPILSTPDVPLDIGRARNNNDVRSFGGVVFGLELRDGAGGTVLTRLDFDTSTTVITDEGGNVFTFGNAQPGTDNALRFTGEISDWPQNWDPTDTDRPTPITAGGITRRTSQWNQTAESAVVAALSNAVGAVGYWPCEDPAGSASFLSLTPGASPGAITGDIRTGEYTQLIPSQPLPVINGDDTNPGSATFTLTGETNRCTFFLHLTGTPETGTVLFSLKLTGTALARVTFEIISGTVGRARGYDADGVLVQNGADIALADIVDEQLVAIFATATVASLNVQLGLVIFERLDGTEIDRSTVGSGLGVGGTGFPTNLVINPAGDALGSGDQLAFGHVIFAPNLSNPVQLAAFTGSPGEPAAVRAQRISQAAGIPFGVIGDARDSTPMGVQRPGTVQQLITECVRADQGMLYEARDAPELRYRTRAGLYNQDPALELDYTDGVFATQPTPLDDDRTLANDITVTTPAGGSATARQETGPLSVQDPPNGVGRYIDTAQPNLASIGQLPNHAGWRLLLGTVDEPRYPSLDLQMASTALAGAQETAVENLDVGSRIVVEGLPATVDPDAVSVLMIGQSETFGIHQRRIALVTTPEAPYRIAEVGGGAVYGTVGSDSAAIAEDLDTTETGIDIDNGAGPDWIHEGTDYDIVIGGERITVTAAGAPSGTFPSRTQTLTVTRSVNGVVKTHSDNDPITMADPVYIGL